MPEVVSMVSAHIAPERIADVVEGFGAAVRAGMPEHRHTSLLRGDAGLIRIVTVWRSRHHLDRHLASVDKPFAVNLLERGRGHRRRGAGTRPGQQHRMVALIGHRLHELRDAERTWATTTSARSA